jgi:hypothetical protein
VAPLDAYSCRFATQGITFKAMPMDNKGTHPVKDSLLILRFIWLFFKLKPACILPYTPKCNIYSSLAADFLCIPIINNVSGLGTAFIKANLNNWGRRKVKANQVVGWVPLLCPR